MGAKLYFVSKAEMGIRIWVLGKERFSSSLLRESHQKSLLPTKFQQHTACHKREPATALMVIPVLYQINRSFREGEVGREPGGMDSPCIFPCIRALVLHTSPRVSTSKEKLTHKGQQCI